MSRILNERSLSSVFLLLIGMGLAVSTFGLESTYGGNAFNPMFFPRIILILWIVLAAANLLTDIVRPEHSEPFRLYRVVTISIAFVVYVIFMRELGFFFSSVALSLLILLTLNIRRPLPLLIVGVGLPLLITVFFNHLLKMPLPSSPLVWWI